MADVDMIGEFMADYQKQPPVHWEADAHTATHGVDMALQQPPVHRVADA